jgi:hypothetical protein
MYNINIHVYDHVIGYNSNRQAVVERNIFIEHEITWSNEDFYDYDFKVSRVPDEPGFDTYTITSLDAKSFQLRIRVVGFAFTFQPWGRGRQWHKLRVFRRYE